MTQPFLSTIPPSSSNQSALDTAVAAARRAGAILLERFHDPKEVTFKGRSDVVTNVDLLVEKEILEILQNEYPQFGIESEETGTRIPGASYRWVVDPIDGTRNYVAGIPHFAVNIALVHQGDVGLAVTYDPFRQELFHAIRGGGAYLNNAPISVSPKKMISQCLLGFDMGYSDERASQALKMIQALWPGMQSIRVMGSAALGLAYAANGRLDLYFHHHLLPWDIASGLLLVNEAGGLTLDHHGEKATLLSPSVIASSPHLIDTFLDSTEGTEWRQ